MKCHKLYWKFLCVGIQLSTLLLINQQFFPLFNGANKYITLKKNLTSSSWLQHLNKKFLLSYANFSRKKYPPYEGLPDTPTCLVSFGLSCKCSPREEVMPLKLKAATKVKGKDSQVQHNKCTSSRRCFFTQKSGRAQASEQKVIQSSTSLGWKFSKRAGWFPMHFSPTGHVFWQSVFCLGSAIWFSGTC